MRCEELANFRKGDRLGPVYAAARLMNANAQVAKALAQVAPIESRRSSIVERIQLPDPKTAELNSRLAKEETDARAKLKGWRRLNEIVEQSIRARSGDTQAEDRVAQVLKEDEGKLGALAEGTRQGRSGLPAGVGGIPIERQGKSCAVLDAGRTGSGGRGGAACTGSGPAPPSKVSAARRSAIATRSSTANTRAKSAR